MLQVGNHVDATWKARLADNLGHFALELRKGFAALLMEDAAALAAMTSMAALARLLPERDPHPNLYRDHAVRAGLSRRCRPVWPALLVRWELALLDELGFGLDLATCAATGRSADLLYVSPKSGRAVSAEAGEPYKDRLLALPPFLRAGSGGRRERARTCSPASRSPGISWRRACSHRATWRCRRRAAVCCRIFAGHNLRASLGRLWGGLGGPADGCDAFHDRLAPACRRDDDGSRPRLRSPLERLGHGPPHRPCVARIRGSRFRNPIPTELLPVILLGLYFGLAMGLGIWLSTARRWRCRWCWSRPSSRGAPPSSSASACREPPTMPRT